ncbi:putative terminase large subunit domain protein [Clostridioides difficile CD39]|nr:hypothetical protein [Clostridioides difficile]EQE50571.1 putative terminase large subunit domain protein [Clostridioides difficile CD39]
MRLSQDFGFNHANVVLRIGFKDGELYICNEIYDMKWIPQKS